MNSGFDLRLIGLVCGVAMGMIMGSCAAETSPKQCRMKPLVDFDKLQNPIYSHDEWSVKDACMAYREDGWFYLFFSAFFPAEGDTRSHVVGVKTRDFKTWSDPLFVWSGHDMGWLGMCSPDIQKVSDTWYLTYNSWGDKSGRPNQLFYAVSSDLENWDHHHQLAPEVTVKDGTATRAIDAAIVHHNDRFVLIWKEGSPHRTRLAWAEKMNGPWQYVGDGYPQLVMPDGQENGMIHENFHFFRYNDKWQLLSLDYRPHTPYLYTMTGDGGRLEDWLHWGQGRELIVPEEAFNTDHRCNAPFIADWRAYDGYFTMIYAGRTQGVSHKRRGDNRLGLARSLDLIHWQVPGQD